MSMAYVQVMQGTREAEVWVEIENVYYKYPLTREGCLQAGKRLFDSGVEIWLNSSSVDFPRDVKPTCRLDVRKWMGRGWEQAEALPVSWISQESMVDELIRLLKEAKANNTPYEYDVATHAAILVGNGWPALDALVESKKTLDQAEQEGGY